MSEIGAWFHKNQESIRGAESNPLAIQSWGDITQKGNRLYLHVKTPSPDGSIILSGLLTELTNAYILEDRERKPLSFQRLNYYDLKIELPQEYRSAKNVVIAADFAGSLQVTKERLICGNDTLQTFDASYLSCGLTHGGGERGRAFVGGFRTSEQTVSWKIRTMNSLTIKAKVTYLRMSETDGGSYHISCGDQQIRKEIDSSLFGLQSPITDCFELTIPYGTSELSLHPDTIAGNFINFLNIRLDKDDQTCLSL